MKKLLTLLFLCFLTIQAFNQTFLLVQPDTIKLRKMEKETNYSESVGYLYLQSNYTSKTGKQDVQHYEWGEPKDICAFKQSFENGINYSVWKCKEAGGVTEVISFPCVDTKTIKRFIENLFYDKWNTWTTDMKYEPEGVGCYYEIKQTEKRTTLEIYCGC